MSKKISFVSPDLFLSETIAIVGSSGILLGSNNGKYIDSFEDVVRFNTSRTDGFEVDVGTKRTLTVINNPILSGYFNGFLDSLRNENILYYGPDIKVWNNRNNMIDDSCKTYLFDYSKMNRCCSEFGFSLGRRKRLRIGTGFVLLCVISGIVPHIFGFDTIRDRERDHYWENFGKPGGHHDIEEEKKLLIKLGNEGKLILHD